MEIVTVAEMREIEREGFEAGTSYEAMVDMVGKAVAAEVDRYPRGLRITGLIGKGNNGADTIVALLELKKKGRAVRAILIDERKEDIYEARLRMGCVPTAALGSAEVGTQVRAFLSETDLILDGVFGIGFRPPLPDRCRPLFRMLNARAFPARIIAVDCVSGMNCDSGETDPDALRADQTVAIHAFKLGQLMGSAGAIGGKLSGVRMRLDPELPVYSRIRRRSLTQSWVQARLPERCDVSHKGAFGTVRIFGGCEKYFGAPALAAEAAYRSGAGLVEINSNELVRRCVASRAAEAVWDTISDDAGENRAALERKLPDRENSAWLVGPGLGMGNLSTTFLDVLFDPEILGRIRTPIFDADALNYLSDRREILSRLPSGTILTPHPGEMARLCGCTVADVNRRRIPLAEEKAREWSAIVVLKGAYTVIAAPWGETAVAPFANAALAKAGSGDVLSGTIAGFAAQGSDPFSAAQLGVWFHGSAGEIFRKERAENRTLLAGEIPGLYSGLFSQIASDYQCVG